MSRNTHYVVRRQDQWTVRTDDPRGDQDMPLYDDRESAIAAAILSAQNSCDEGRSSQVFVEEPDGEFRLERSYDAAR